MKLHVEDPIQLLRERVVSLERSLSIPIAYNRFLSFMSLFQTQRVLICISLRRAAPSTIVGFVIYVVAAFRFDRTLNLLTLIKRLARESRLFEAQFSQYLQQQREASPPVSKSLLTSLPTAFDLSKVAQSQREVSYLYSMTPKYLLSLHIFIWRIFFTDGDTPRIHSKSLWLPFLFFSTS